MKQKRILVASIGTIPGYSGGWTTPLDLLGDDFDVSYLVTAGRPGRYSFEGVSVTSIASGFNLSGNWPILNRLRIKLFDLYFQHSLKACYNRISPDLVMALDIPTALACIHLSIPYIMRFHSEPESFSREIIDRIVKLSIFSTTTPSVSLPGVHEIPHNVNLGRFKYSEAAMAKKVILVSTLNSIRCPMLFVEGVMMSSLQGAVVGTGPLAEEVRRACESSNGKVEYIPPVPRLQLPDLLSSYQVGVATYARVPEIYQMKVNGYLATGLMTVVMPWTHLAIRAPEITMVAQTSEQLAEKLDWIRENWEQTLPVRRAARDWVHQNYSLEKPLRIFAGLLKKHLGSDWS